MQIPVTFIFWGIAAFPILLLLILLLKFQISLVKASLASMLVAIITAFIFFKCPIPLIASEIAKGIWNSLSIILVIFPAILMYEVSKEANAFNAIQCCISKLIPDGLIQVLTVGWCFTAFLQGPSGFGVPIAVAAPLLIGIGVKPLWAVVIPMLAQGWGSTFGTLGLAWEALVYQTNLAEQIGSPIYWETAGWAAILIGILCIASGWLICWFYGGLKGVRHGTVAVIILGGIQAGGQLILSQMAPVLCAFIPSTIALFAAFALSKLKRYSGKTIISSEILTDKECIVDEKENTIRLWQAVLPYTLLVVISLVALLTPALNAILGAWKMSFSFPAVETGYGLKILATESYSPLRLLLHSGFFIFFATCITAFFYIKNKVIHPRDIKKFCVNTLKKSLPASLAVIFMIVLSKVMSGSGAIYVLAQGTAAVTGTYYALLTPVVGGLGTFISASNVSSNILFGQFQESMANILGMNEQLFLAAQTSGAAAGSVMDPAKILLGATTAGILGQEAEVLRKLWVFALVIITIMGLIVMAFA